MTNKASLRDHASALVRCATRAPSSHNTQPWRFRVSDAGIDLLADRTRALTINDPEDRELTISCGCALLNLRVAAAGHGLAVRVEVLPDPIDPDWLARVSLEPGTDSPREETGLSDQIERRRTYRKDFASDEVAGAAVDDLIDAADAEGAWFRAVVSQEDRKMLGRLIAEGDVAQWSDPLWRRELAAWMRPRRRGDGLTVPVLAGPIIRLVVRAFDMGARVSAKDRALAETAPLLAVLGTQRDEPRAWLSAGQALQRVLLTACGFGLQASYLNQPVQVASLRPEVQRLIGGGFPQVVLRFGYPRTEVAPTPRRSMEDVMDGPS